MGLCIIYRGPHPGQQVFFTKEWAQLVETSFRNFIAEVIQKLPLPAVLRFDTDRRLRVSLQHQCRQLQKEKARLEKVQLAPPLGLHLRLVDHENCVICLSPLFYLS